MASASVGRTSRMVSRFLSPADYLEIPKVEESMGSESLHLQ